MPGRLAARVSEGMGGRPRRVKGTRMRNIMFQVGALACLGLRLIMGMDGRRLTSLPRRETGR